MLQPTPSRSGPGPRRPPTPSLSRSHRALSPPALDLEPEVRASLRKHGRDSAPRPGEDGLAFERRLQTDLMAVFKQTRSHAIFNELHRRTSPLLLAWVKGLLHKRSARANPHDLVQDTFVNIYSYADSFKEGKAHTFMGWARTIAANVMRRELRRGRMVPLEETHCHVDRRPGPTCRAQYSEEVDAIRQAWTLFLMLYLAAYQSLGRRDQRALHLTEVQDMDYEEVARELGVGRKNVKMIMFRARKRLQESMRCQLVMGRAGSVRSAG